MQICIYAKPSPWKAQFPIVGTLDTEIKDSTVKIAQKNHSVIWEEHLKVSI